MSEKQPTYVAPALVELGTISALTLGNSGKSADGSTKKKSGK